MIKTSLRLVRKSVGLFDKGLAGIKPLAFDSSSSSLPGLPPGPSFSDMTTNVGDLLASLDYLCDNCSDIDALINSNNVDGAQFDISESMMQDLDLETFTDLSDLLEGTFEGLDETPVVDTDLGQLALQVITTESLPPAQPVIPVSIPISPCPRSERKRKMVISDHDYVSKPKRIAMSPVEGLPDIAESPQVSEVILDNDLDEFEMQGSPQSPVASYSERRRKNNIASRRSREIKKRKFVNMDEEADRLEIDNKRLAEKIVELEQVAKEMKALLVQKVAGRIASNSTS